MARDKNPGWPHEITAALPAIPTRSSGVDLAGRLSRWRETSSSHTKSGVRGAETLEVSPDQRSCHESGRAGVLSCGAALKSFHTLVSTA
jgi:hypothetical protein